jgi:RimJ/RimL family protein N-acetyltransferase
MKENKMPAMPLFETKRVLLRPFQDSDLDLFYAYRSDPAVARYQGWGLPYSRAKAAAFIEEMKHKQPALPGEWYQVAIVLKTSAALIGDCAFRVFAEDDRQADIGFTLSALFQGQGYAAEAVVCLLNYLFGELKLHRVIAVCDVENTASIRLLEHLKMRREAHYLQSFCSGGQWGCEYGYAILKDEWFVSKSIVE